MKKSLLAVAVAAALPAVAFAQTNVTMYGIADVGAGYVKPDQVGTSGAFRVDSGIQSTSRWGIRGTEDLGGGLSAIFNAEAEWGVDDGTGGSNGNGINFQRRSFVGLQGRFGQLYMGRDYTPSFYAGLANDLFGFGMNGSTLGLNVMGYQTIRTSNAVFYNSPSMGGLQIRASYGKASAAGTEYYDAAKKRDSSAEIAALYSAGPIQANAYYRQGYANVQSTPPGADPAKIKQYGGGFGWNFGVARVVAGVGLSDPDGSANPLVPGAPAGTVGVGTYDRALFWNLGAGVRAGAGEVMAQWTHVKYRGSDAKADTYGVAYTYPLSKRTNLYATYATTRNKDGAAVIVRNGGNSYGGGVAGINSKPQAVAFGIRHQF